MRGLLWILALILLLIPLLITPPAAGPTSALVTLCLIGYTSSVLIRLVRPSGNLEYTITGEGDSHTEKTWTVPDSTADQLCNIAIDVDKVTLFYIVSTQDVTIETNNGTTPDNTLSLKAGKPYFWEPDSLDTFLLTVDVTKFYITNNSGSSATVYCDVIQDSTP